jgi:ribosomal protein S1
MVLEEENDEGMIVLSLRMASQQKAWDHFYNLIDDDATMEFTAQEVNRGGLISNVDGIRAFLPLSQLAPANYPRVNNNDSGEIMARLAKFIGHTFTVKIITMDEDAGKIVVSEREAMAEERSKALEGLTIGAEKEGLVSGIVKFGIFVAFEGLEGLVHISEIAWGHVRNPSEHVKMGDRVKVKVIGVDSDKLSLSMKQLQQDPWEVIVEKYPLGSEVSGPIVRFADYGAFMKLDSEINGLIHLTEIAHHKIKDPSDTLTIGEKVKAQVISIDLDERRIGLSVKALLPIDKATLAAMQAEREEETKVEKTKEVKEVAEVKEVSSDNAKDEKKDKASDADDLTKIEGVGPKIAETLVAAGIATFADLSTSKIGDLRTILEEAKLSQHDPGTWKKQATLAKNDKWDELKVLQDELDGGKPA